jgi:hypothetical protein
MASPNFRNEAVETHFETPEMSVQPLPLQFPLTPQAYPAYYQVPLALPYTFGENEEQIRFFHGGGYRQIPVPLPLPLPAYPPVPVPLPPIVAPLPPIVGPFPPVVVPFPPIFI